MQSVASSAAFPSTLLPRVGRLPKLLPNAETFDKKLYEMHVDKLREAIRNHQVSFPSQLPTFSKHTRPDLQRKLAQLYFICGWSGPKIRARYGLGAQRLQQILSTWKNRAVELGYIQVIPPDQRVMLSVLPHPIRVVLSRAANGSCAPALPAVRRFEARKNGDHQKAYGNRREISCRPRRKCDTSQIADVLKRLQASRSIADMADEVGVTVTTIRIWKRQQEMRLLRRENRELKELLAKVGAIGRTDRPH